MAEAERKGHPITFDVLYYAKSKSYSCQREEIGQKEGEYIRQYKPILNAQIPKAEDWNTWDVSEVDAREILKAIL